MKKQTEQFTKESLRYVTKYLGRKPDGKFLKIWQGEELLEGYRPANILDVGAGGGGKLEFLITKFGSKGVGLEPSSDGVNLLNEQFKQNENISFCEGSAHNMPFDTDSFDLVLIWQVLQWVGRNEYLQAIGELIRVTKEYLVIQDFSASKDYRTPYHHDLNFFTYKMDFEPLLIGSGVMEKVFERRWRRSHPDNVNETVDVVSSDLVPFLGNPANYWAEKLIVFKKNYGVLPSLMAEDFKTNNFRPFEK